MAVVKPASKGAVVQKLVATSLASLMFTGTLINPTVAEAQSGTSTPIKHLVVIFQENILFDHYFGTYPNALNPPNEPTFKPAPGTPAVNGFTVLPTHCSTAIPTT
jgi:phospholipase C